jgi:plasmid stabilization system protein ParE
VARIRWSQQAADDLEAIHDFIARDSAHYARLLCADIVAAVDQLADYPQLGHPGPELQVPEFREVLVGNYRVVYRLEFVDVVEVVTVCHGARLLRLKERT